MVYFPARFHKWASGGRVSGKPRTIFALAGSDTKFIRSASFIFILRGFVLVTVLFDAETGLVLYPVDVHLPGHLGDRELLTHECLPIKLWHGAVIRLVCLWEHRVDILTLSTRSIPRLGSTRNEITKIEDKNATLTLSKQ